MSKFARSVILASLISATAQANTPVPTPNANPVVVPAAPEISAKAHILIDYYSGQVLAEQNAEERLPPASLTKMMTSYIIGQELLKGNIKRTDMVTISQNAWSKNYSDSSKMFIEVGKQVSVDDLNKGIIIQSGNDACVAMAEFLAGSTDSFASLMNSWAAKLGMNDSHFMNPHGLDAEGHDSTAHDMARLGQALIVTCRTSTRFTPRSPSCSTASPSTTATVCCGINPCKLTASRPATSARSATTWFPPPPTTKACA